MKALYLKILLILCTTFVIACPVFAEEMSYTANLSTATPTDWVLPTGAISGGNQILINTLNYGCYYNAINWSGKYTFRADVKNDWGGDSNQALLLFNAIDASNTYYIAIGGGKTNTVAFGKKVNGDYTVISSKPFNKPLSNFGTIEVTYDNGDVTVKEITTTGETIILDKVFDKNRTYTNGKIGLGTSSDNATFKNISVVGNGVNVLLHFVSTDLVNTQSVALSPVIKTTFNQLLKDESVKVGVRDKDGAIKVPGTILIYRENDTTAMAPELYRVKVVDDYSIVVSFTKDLDEKTNYKIKYTAEILSRGYNQKLAPYEINFKTKPPAFDVVPDLLDGSGASIKNFVVASAGQVATIKLVITNNEAAATQPYAITAAIMNDSGRMYFSKSFTGTINLGETQTLTQQITIPANIDDDPDDGSQKLYIYSMNSFENMGNLIPQRPVIIDNYDFVNVGINLKDDKVTISGVLPNLMVGRKLNLIVVNPNKDIANILTDGSVAQKQASLVTDKFGGFTITFPINTDANSVTGDYKIYLSGDDFTTPLVKTFYFSLRPERIGAITAINNAADVTAMMTAFDTYADIMSLHFGPFDAIDRTKVAEKVLEKIAIAPFATDDASIVRDYIWKYCLIEAYNQNKSEVLFASDGKFLYPEILNLSSVDTDRNMTVNAFYSNTLSKIGRQKLNKKMMGNGFVELEDFYNKFIEEVVVLGINNSSLSGFGHISPLLTQNTENVAGTRKVRLDLTKYVSQNADKKLVVSTIIDLADLQKKINAYSVPDPVKPPKGGSGGGGGSSSTPISIVGTIPPANVPVLENEKPKTIEIADMADVDWAVASVKGLIEKKVITEPVDGNFRPNDYITREEFVKMVVLALKLDTTKSEAVFEDVSADDWSAPYITAAKTAGIITGVDDKHFGKKDQITRQDVAVIINRAFKPQASGTDETEDTKFSDSEKISDYAVEAVKLLSKISVINGMEDGSFAPNDYCTRAQSAKIIFGMLK